MRVDMYLLFIIFHAFCMFGIVFSQSSLSNGTRIETLCEKDSVNITCDDMSRIVINDVQFGPLLYKNDASGITNSTVLDKQDDIILRTAIMCNGTSYCFIDNNDNEFTTTWEYIPRLVNITYTCEYDYVGCFQDQKERLLDKAAIHYYNNWQNMSAKTCYTYCDSKLDSYKYFGTEDRNECFCGDGSQLGKTNYRNYSDDTCNVNCSGNPKEMCGRHGFISVYRTFDTGQYIGYNKQATHLMYNYCPYGAMLNAFSVTSTQKSKECDVYLENRVSSGFLWCDGVSCFLEDRYENFQNDDEMHVIPQFARINYSCIPLDIAGESMGADGTGSGSNSMLVIGASVGGLVVFIVIVLIICFVKRRKPSREKNAGSTSNHRAPGINSANTEREENVYFNSGGDMHEDQTYENSQQRPVDDSTDHIYQVSAKHKKFQTSNDKRINVSTNKDQRHSSSSDHYADHVEGVYDISHKVQYKDNDGGQAIYSHAVEDVYDSAEAHSRPEPREGDDLYDKFSSQT